MSNSEDPDTLHLYKFRNATKLYVLAGCFTLIVLWLSVFRVYSALCLGNHLQSVTVTFPSHTNLLFVLMAVIVLMRRKTESWNSMQGGRLMATFMDNESALARPRK